MKNTNFTYYRKGEVAEWLKAHAWKACKGETLSWVRIPFSPPISFINFKDITKILSKRIYFILGLIYGGERGIRTLETVSRLHAFQACAFNHSATSPICNPQ